MCSSTVVVHNLLCMRMCSSTVHNLLNIYGFQAEPKGYRSGRRKKSSQYTHHPEPHGRDHGRLHFITQAKFNSGRSLQGQEMPPSTCARTEELESVRQEVQATRQVSEATKQLVQAMSEFLGMKPPATPPLMPPSPPPPSPTPPPLSPSPSPSPPPPSPSPPPQKRPVECGRPDYCSKAAGLKDPNEGHAVRALATHRRINCPCSPPSHPCAARCAAARRPRPFRIRPKGISTPGPRTLVALFGVGQMRAQTGTARKTRPSRRLRPSAKRQTLGSAPPRSSWTAVRRARAVDLIGNWSGPSLCRRRRQPRRRQDRYHSSPL